MSLMQKQLENVCQPHLPLARTYCTSYITMSTTPSMQRDRRVSSPDALHTKVLIHVNPIPSCTLPSQVSLRYHLTFLSLSPAQVHLYIQLIIISLFNYILYFIILNTQYVVLNGLRSDYSITFKNFLNDLYFFFFEILNLLARCIMNESSVTVL